MAKATRKSTYQGMATIEGYRAEHPGMVHPSSDIQTVGTLSLVLTCQNSATPDVHMHHCTSRSSESEVANTKGLNDLRWLSKEADHALVPIPGSLYANAMLYAG